MNILKNTVPKAADRFLGFLCLKICRADMIRLMNLFRMKGVRFWHMRVTEKDVRLRISLFGCDEALAYAADANIAVEVEHRVGLPFILHRYRRRAGLAVGAVLAAALVFSSMLFVWDIEITGNSAVSESRILSALSKSGLSVGAFIPGIGTHSVEESTVLTLPELSSVAVVITGTHVSVDVIERKRPPEIYDMTVDGISSIYASEDGIIRSVVAESGKSVVRTGEVVAKGDLLVTGIYDGHTGIKIAVRSKATVMAETYRKFVISVPLRQPVKHYTGNEAERTVVTVLGRRFELFFGAMLPYDRFDADVTTEKPLLFGFIRTPVEITTLYAKEYISEHTEYTKEEALAKAIAAFDSRIGEIRDGEVLSKSYEWFYDDAADCVTLKGEVALLTDIASEAPVQISASP